MKGRSTDDTSDLKIPEKIRLDKVQWDIIQGLTPFYGNTKAEVVRTIVTMWIHDNIGSEAIRKLEELEAIHFK
jgi:hypothetical protein